MSGGDKNPETQSIDVSNITWTWSEEEQGLFDSQRKIFYQLINQEDQEKEEETQERKGCKPDQPDRENWYWEDQNIQEIEIGIESAKLTREDCPK